MREIQVKQTGASSRWIWGAFKMRGATMHELHELWLERDRCDPYIGTLVNAWIARGRQRAGVHGRHSRTSTSARSAATARPSSFCPDPDR